MTQTHGYGGFKGEYDMDVLVIPSAADTAMRTTGDGENRDIKHMYHAEFDYVHFIDMGYSPSSPGCTNSNLGGQLYERGSTFAGAQKAGLGSIVFEHGFDNIDVRPGVRTQYYAGILSWNATESLIVKSTIGSQRGGLKCVGGFAEFIHPFPVTNSV